MGAHWGSSWFVVSNSVLNKKHLTGVIYCSKYPLPSGKDEKGNEATAFALPECHAQTKFLECKNQRDAEIKAKQMILSQTQDDLLAHIYAMESSRCEIEELKFNIKNKLSTDIEHDRIKLNNAESSLRTFEEKVKELKQARKAKVNEYSETDVSRIFA